MLVDVPRRRNWRTLHARAAGLIGMVLLAIVEPRASQAQSVEVFASADAVSADVMFFNYFKDGAGKPSPVLLFHRSRALVDYDLDQIARTNLPQFGMTNALSFNPAAWKGVAPVLAFSVSSGGAAAKLGLQYSRVRPRLLVFGWGVTEAHAAPAVDLFVLLRVVRPLSTAVGLYTQFEALDAIQHDARKASVSIVRARTGIDVKQWQMGIGADIRHSASGASTTTTGVGLFVRHAF